MGKGMGRADSNSLDDFDFDICLVRVCGEARDNCGRGR